MKLIELVKELLSNDAGRALLNQHGFLPADAPGVATAQVSVAEIIAVLQLICAAASVACPIIDSL